MRITSLHAGVLAAAIAGLASPGVALAAATPQPTPSGTPQVVVADDRCMVLPPPVGCPGASPRPTATPTGRGHGAARSRSELPRTGLSTAELLETGGALVGLGVVALAAAPLRRRVTG
jgi:hypothetical protein